VFLTHRNSSLIVLLILFCHIKFILAGYQVERPISELLLTLFAQRHGIDIWHGHQADAQKTVLSAEGDVIPIKNVAAGTSVETKSPLVVDGTGRFRQIGSKYSRVKRFDGWNTDAFWAYFECKDEDRLPDVSILPFYYTRRVYIYFANFYSAGYNITGFPLLRGSTYQSHLLPRRLDLGHSTFELAGISPPQLDRHDSLPH
jgi:hypothetical protein